LDIAEGNSACTIEKNAIKNITDSEPPRAQPVALSFTECVCGDRAAITIGVAAVDITPICICLNAEQEGAGLQIKAQRAANKEPRGVEGADGPRRSRPITGAEAVAAVYADIEAPQLIGGVVGK